MKSSSPASGPPSPKGEGSRFPLWGEWRIAPRYVTAFPFGEGGGVADGRGNCLPFYFCFNSATIATIIEIIEAIAANNPNK